MTAVLDDVRIGSQESTFRLVPEHPPAKVDDRDGRDACAFAARFGLVADPWQRALVSQTWMLRDVDTGRWLAGTWGIAVPRQNGKNGALEIFEIYALVVLRLNILHTAHQVKTAQKHFRRLKRFFGSKADDPQAIYPELNRLVKEIRSTNGQEAIYLWDPDTGEDLGSIEIAARSKGSARGFTNDVLVIDEAQHLTAEQLEALRPAISAAPSGDPIAIYMGTPPDKGALTEEGEGTAFLRIRNRAVTREATRSAWMEFGLVDVDLDLMTDDEVRALAENQENWFATNPALGIRLNVQTIIDEFTEMGPRSFCRERLCVFPSAAALSSAVMDADEWDGATVSQAPNDHPLDAVGLDMDPVGRVWVGVAVHGEGSVHVELLPQDITSGGQDAAVEWLWQRCKKKKPVVVPSDSGAAVLEAPLRAKGMKVYRLSTFELVQSAAGMVRSTRDGEMTHLDDPVIAKAVAESGRITLSTGLWRIGRNGDLGGAPLLAISCARFGAVKWSGRRRSGKSRFG